MVLDALEYLPCIPYNPPLAPRKKKVNTRRTKNNTGDAVIVPTILFPTVPEEDVEEMDWEPIVDEDNIQLVECAPQQEEETILEEDLSSNVGQRFILLWCGR